MTLPYQEVCQLARRFVRHEPTVLPKPFGNGHINDTYVYEGDGRKLILQRINRYVFHRPEEVMDNILRITEHLRRKIVAQGGDASRETLRLNLTQEGEPYTADSMGEIWRCYWFVDDTLTYESTLDPHIIREAGACFGRFQAMLDDFDAASLHETIVQFHHMPKRFRDFQQAVSQNRSGRAASAQAEIEGVLGYESLPPILQQKLESGALPLRVAHNDTKLNNVLMDKQTGRGVCVIDLDTVMPGLSAYDFGDTIRTGASTAVEDEPDLSKVHLNMALYRAFAEGYLKEFGHQLTKEELVSLPMGARLMTMECLMRTLGDYIDGDIYYKVDYPEHNLVRARTQLKLMREMDAHWDEMNAIVLELGKGIEK